MFFSDYEIADTNSAHPQFLPPTLLLYFNLKIAVKRKAAVLWREWADSATAAVYCLKLVVFQMQLVQSRYLQDPPARSWFPVGTVFLLGPPQPHHHSSVGHIAANTEKHIFNIIDIIKSTSHTISSYNILS